MRRARAVLALVALCSCARAPRGGVSAGAGSFGPHLSRLGSRIALSWVEPDASGAPSLRFAIRSGDGWSDPRPVARDPNLAADSADVPGVVPLDERRLAAYWTVKRKGSSVARSLLVAISNDGGATWSRPVSPHRDDSDSEHGMASVIPSGNGAFGIAWLDGRAGAHAEYGEGGTSLYWAEWQGDSFGPETLLDPRVCDCCKTSAAWTASGPIVAYRDRGDGERRDIAFVRRTGGGWSAPAEVRVDGWHLTACPTNGPAVACGGGQIAIAWFTGAAATPAIYLTRGTGNGAALGAPERLDGGAPVGRVDAAMLPDGSAAAVWLERKGDAASVRLRRVRPDGNMMPSVDVATTSASRASGYPSLVAAGGDDVIVAWTDVAATRRVRTARVSLR